jgi:hypothetical protein
MLNKGMIQVPGRIPQKPVIPELRKLRLESKSETVLGYPSKFQATLSYIGDLVSKT